MHSIHFKNVLLWLFLFVAGLGLPAQHCSEVYDTALFQRTVNFIKSNLQLKVRDNFYMQWKPHDSDSMYYYLYVSKPDTIQTALDGNRVFYYFTSADTAAIQEQFYRESGMHTLLYKTAGTSGAELNCKLVGYPAEAIVFILLHEATHQHIRGSETKINYAFEEAMCDAVAVVAGRKYLRKAHPSLRKAFRLQTMVLEGVYKHSNNYIDGYATFNSGLKIRLEKALKTVEKNGNAFMKDRMLYPVNNAYLRRISDYSVHYFRMKKLLGGKGDFSNKLHQAIELSKIK